MTNPALDRLQVGLDIDETTSHIEVWSRPAAEACGDDEIESLSADRSSNRSRNRGIATKTWQTSTGPQSDNVENETMSKCHDNVENGALSKCQRHVAEALSLEKPK